MADKRGKKKEKKKADKFIIDTEKVTGKAVTIFSAKGDQPAVGGATVLKGQFGGKVVLTGVGETGAARRKSVKFHRTEAAAVTRLGRKFPSLTPRLRKRL